MLRLCKRYETNSAAPNALPFDDPRFGGFGDLAFDREPEV
jgi:hypothetical protein